MLVEFGFHLLNHGLDVVGGGRGVSIFQTSFEVAYHFFSQRSFSQVLFVANEIILRQDSCISTQSNTSATKRWTESRESQGIIQFELAQDRLKINDNDAV